MIKKENNQVSLDGVISALESLDKKFDKKFDAFDKRFDTFDKRFDAFDKRFDAADKKVETLGVRMENLEKSHRNMGLQLDKLEHKFDLCIEGFGGLNERTSKIEGRVSILEGRA